MWQRGNVKYPPPPWIGLIIYKYQKITKKGDFDSIPQFFGIVPNSFWANFPNYYRYLPNCFFYQPIPYFSQIFDNGGQIFENGGPYLVLTKKLIFYHFSNIYFGNTGPPPPQGQNSQNRPFSSRNNKERLKIKWTLMDKIDQILLPPVWKTCFSILGWIWHAKNDFVIVQKFWE